MSSDSELLSLVELSSGMHGSGLVKQSYQTCPHVVVSDNSLMTKLWLSLLPDPTHLVSQPHTHLAHPTPPNWWQWTFPWVNFTQNALRETLQTIQLLPITDPNEVYICNKNILLFKKTTMQAARGKSR